MESKRIKDLEHKAKIKTLPLKKIKTLTLHYYSSLLKFLENGEDSQDLFSFSKESSTIDASVPYYPVALRTLHVEMMIWGRFPPMKFRFQRSVPQRISRSHSKEH